MPPLRPPAARPCRTALQVPGPVAGPIATASVAEAGPSRARRSVRSSLRTSSADRLRRGRSRGGSGARGGARRPRPPARTCATRARSTERLQADPLPPRARNRVEPTARRRLRNPAGRRGGATAAPDATGSGTAGPHGRKVSRSRRRAGRDPPIRRTAGLATADRPIALRATGDEAVGAGADPRVRRPVGPPVRSPPAGSTADRGRTGCIADAGRGSAQMRESA